MNKVQMYMEEACDQYFKDIEPRAVKVSRKYSGNSCYKTRVPIF